MWTGSPDGEEDSYLYAIIDPARRSVESEKRVGGCPSVQTDWMKIRVLFQH